MKIGRLLGKGRGTISRLSRMGLVGLYMALLGVFLSLGILGGIPGRVKADDPPVYGYMYFYMSLYDSPAAGGTTYVTGGAPNAFGWWSTDTTLLFTAVPNPGYRFVTWSELLGGTVNAAGALTVMGHSLSTQTRLREIDWATGGNGIPSISQYAIFAPATVAIDCKATTGFTWTGGAGTKTGVLGEYMPLTVTLNSSYTSLYEWTGWIGSQQVINRLQNVESPPIPDTLNPSVLLYLNPADAWDEGPYWLQPTMALKSVVSDNATITWTQDPGGGYFSWSNPITVGVGTHVSQKWYTDNSMIQFDHWDLNGVGCTNPEDAYTQFWPLEAGAVSATAMIVSAINDVYDQITMAVTPPGYGTTFPSVGDHIYLEGSVITLRAYPATGREFVRWDGLNDGLQWDQLTVNQTVRDNTPTYTAVFQSTTVVPPGGGAGGDGTAAASGIWGGITNSLSSVGLGNPMGRMMVVLAGMVIVGVMAGKNKYMRVAGPLGILGIGIIGFWVPIWIVIVLAIGAGVGLLGFFGKRTAA